MIKNEPQTRTSIETIEKATAAHRATASKLLIPISSIPEVSPRPESSASGSMDSAELRIKEEMDDSGEGREKSPESSLMGDCKERQQQISR